VTKKKNRVKKINKEKAYRDLLVKAIDAFRKAAESYPNDLGLVELAELFPKILNAIDGASSYEELEKILRG